MWTTVQVDEGARALPDNDEIFHLAIMPGKETARVAVLDVV